MATTSATFTCDLCQKKFRRNGDLTRHKAIHSGEKNHLCEWCGMRFSQKSGLKTHINTHTGMKPHQCDFCEKSFSDPSSCSRHEKEKHFGKPFQCLWCTSNIVRRSSFASHLRSKHPEIRHLVTKEFLDSLQGPHALKPRNMRGIHRSATAPHILTEATGWEPRASSSVTLPTLMRGERVESPGSSSTLVRENDYHLRNTNLGALFVGAIPVPQELIPELSQRPPAYQQPGFGILEHKYGYTMNGSGDRFSGTSSTSSSPGSSSSPDMGPPVAYIEPSMINPVEYAIFGPEQHMLQNTHTYTYQPSSLYRRGM